MVMHMYHKNINVFLLFGATSEDNFPADFFLSCSVAIFHCAIVICSRRLFLLMSRDGYAS